MSQLPTEPTAQNARPGRGGGAAGTSMNSCTLKRPESYALAATFDVLPPGQRRVAEALVGGGVAPTYEQVAEALELHVETVLGYLNRIRTRRPEVYADLVVLRGRQLGARHVGAVKRALAHSQ